MSNTVEIRIQSIEDIGFAIHEPRDPIPSPAPENNFDIEVGVNIEISPEEQLLTIRMRLELRPRLNVENAKKPSPLLTYEGKISYHVKGIKLQEKIKDDDISLPKELVLTALATTYSTFRGVVYSKCGSSTLRHVSLPMIGVDSLFNLVVKKGADKPNIENK